jgi:signal transduction histidine kinase
MVFLKKAQKSIFNAGVSSKKSGWGMGLSLAKRIVESYHGGKLYVGQSSEKGTEMILQLPLN